MAKKDLEKQQWIDIFDGKKVKGADKKIKLNARLARAAFEENEAKIEKEWRARDHDALLQKILKEGEEMGYLEKPSFNLSTPLDRFLSKLVKNQGHWLAPLLIGGSFFSYAMKDGIHITDIQEVPPTHVEVSETFWDIVMDETGNRLTAFWPTQTEQITEIRTTFKVPPTDCSSELLTLDGCLKLQHKHQAQFNIGLIYEQGLIGVEKNLDKAYEWYQKSAAQGNQRAKFNIEYMISKKMINK
jgi:TPR repeat protein